MHSLLPVLSVFSRILLAFCPAWLVPLGWAWVALIVYASLFPFEGWRWPPGWQKGPRRCLPA